MLQPMQLMKRWLWRLEVPVSEKILEQQLLSHPDYPSLLSITDTLDALGVENMALVVDKDKLDSIPVPFLAHTTVQGFVLVENVQQLLKKQPDFIEKWNGVIVAAEKPAAFITDDQHTKGQREERRRVQVRWLAASVLIIFVAAALLNGFTWIQMLLMLTALAGTAISALIVMQELGVSSPVTEQLCSAGKQTDCNAVIQSKGATLMGWLKWSDIGIIYFSAITFLWITALFTAQIAAVSSITAIVAAASLPFTIYSIYYQWRVVKKWCTLCLITVGILWAQLALMLPALTSFSTSGIVALNMLALTAFIFFFTATSWLLLIKPLLFRQKDLSEEQQKLLRFKRNPVLFTTLLEKQRKVDTAPFSHDLQLGNADAPVQIMVACNPYCGPCAHAHKTLHWLLERYDNTIGVTVRFTYNGSARDDKRTQAVEYILAYVQKEFSDMSSGERSKSVKALVHDWFLQMNEEKFAQQYALNTDPASAGDWAADHGNWCNDSKIAFTPTVFINGYELIQPYSLNDLSLLMPTLKEKIASYDSVTENVT